MSNPLSIISSITGVITVATQIINTATRVCESDKDAPESIKGIKEEMQDLRRMFCDVQLIILGKSKSRPIPARMAMISVHHLVTTLSGCVLVCSKLGEILSRASRIVKADEGTGSSRGEPSTRWKMWNETEVFVVMEDLRQYKSVLKLMLNVIECKNTAEANKSLVQLHELVAKILDSKNSISLQLTKIIERQEPIVSNQPATDRGSFSHDTHDNDSDTASFETSTTLVGSVFPNTFMDELKKSRPYKRLNQARIEESSESVFSTSSMSTRGGRWSLLSAISLGDLSISDISVLELPICETDLWDPTPYKTSEGTFNVTEALSRPRWYLPRVMSILRPLETRVVNINPYLNSLTQLPDEALNELTPLIHASFEGREALCVSLLQNLEIPLENVLKESAVTPVLLKQFRYLVHKNSTNICPSLLLLMVFGDDVGRCVRWICQQLLGALERGDNKTARALLEHPQLQVDMIASPTADLRFADFLGESPTRVARRTKCSTQIREALHPRVDINKIPEGKLRDILKNDSGIKGRAKAVHLLFLRFANARTRTTNVAVRPKENIQDAMQLYKDTKDIFAGNAAFENMWAPSEDLAREGSADIDEQPAHATPLRRCRKAGCLCKLLSNSRPDMEVQIGSPSGVSYSSQSGPKPTYKPETGLQQARADDCQVALKLLSDLVVCGAHKGKHRSDADKL